MNHAAPSDTIASRAFLKSLHSSGAPSQMYCANGSFEQAVSEVRADVVLFAPTSAQCRDRQWLKVALTQCMATMAPGAVVYVVAPRLGRWRIANSLRDHGLTIGVPIIHLRSGAARFYVPLTHRGLKFVLRTFPQSHRWRYIMRLLKTVPGSSDLLALALPKLGFPAYHPGAPPFAWLLGRLGNPNNGEAVVSTSWRGPDGATLVFGFTENSAEPTLVAKFTSPALGETVSHEARMLKQRGPAAERAGVHVPRLIDYSQSAERGLLLLNAVPGQPVSRFLYENPGELSTIINELSAWLMRWHRETLSHVKFTWVHFEQLVLAPARSLLEELDCGHEYLAWLSKASSRLVGRTLPVVSTHNDLTMTNVLKDRDGHISIVDWETALPDGLPLADFWYSVCDAAAAIASGGRASAFDECFAVTGGYRELIATHERQLRAVVGGPVEWIELCFHACWLQHAANEQARDSSSDDRQFLAIANRLVRLAL